MLQWLSGGVPEIPITESSKDTHLWLTYPKYEIWNKIPIP